jgi:hypothetical protein
MKKLALVLLFPLLISACDRQIQTTSGADYLARHQETATGQDKGSFEQQLRQAAAVEPTLAFPARIGIARIDSDGNGYARLTDIPQGEAEAWGKLQEKLGTGFGEFVPVSTMVANMVAGSVNSERGNDNRVGDAVNQIRLAAARQHLDAVFVYETYSKQSESENILSLGKVTILGGFILPSKQTEAQGFADGLLIDVLQGYPYATLQTVVSKESKISSAWGWGSESYNDTTFADHVKAQAAKQLAEKAYDALTQLRTELEKKQKEKKDAPAKKAPKKKADKKVG